MRPAMTRGRFITIEGGEGAGKSTQLRHLAARPARARHRLPGHPRARRHGGCGGDPRADRPWPARALARHWPSSICSSPPARITCTAPILPALDRGEWVLCDRFANSTRVYQGCAGEPRPGAGRCPAGAAAGRAPPRPDPGPRPAGRGRHGPLRRTRRHGPLRGQGRATITSGSGRASACSPAVEPERFAVIDASADEASRRGRRSRRAVAARLGAAMIAPEANPHLFGHERSRARPCSRAWESGRLPHAWLLRGPRGVGKATLAYRFARRLLAGADHERAAADPDHPVFRMVAHRAHPDLRCWSARSTRRPASFRATSWSSRSATRTLALHATAARDGYKVLIVDPADELNAVGRQRAPEAAGGAAAQHGHAAGLPAPGHPAAHHPLALHAAAR